MRMKRGARQVSRFRSVNHEARYERPGVVLLSWTPDWGRENGSSWNSEMGKKTLMLKPRVSFKMKKSQSGEATQATTMVPMELARRLPFLIIKTAVNFRISSKV